MSMDKNSQLKQILEAVKRNPHMDGSSMRIILNRLNALRNQLRMTSNFEVNDDDILEYFNDEMNEAMRRQTWQPTIYEYIVFAIVVVFIISVFGKQNIAI